MEDSVNWGYARVSSTSQNLDRQLEQLKAYSTVVSTNGTGGTFRLLGRACPCPTNNLAAIDGTASAAPAIPTT